MSRNWLADVHLKDKLTIKRDGVGALKVFSVVLLYNSIFSYFVHGTEMMDAASLSIDSITTQASSP